MSFDKFWCAAGAAFHLTPATLSLSQGRGKFPEFNYLFGMLTTMFRCLIFYAGLSLALSSATSATSADELTIEVDGATMELSGRVLVAAQDESLLFQSTDGKIWFVQPEQIKQQQVNEKECEPISKKEMGEKLLAELPDGFRVFETKHYVIAYQNEVEFARWIGGLYESRLYRGFEIFWQKKKKFELHDPEVPLAAIIFGSKEEYDRYVTRELGTGQEMVAYYNLQTNRVTMYDLTADQLSGAQSNARSIMQILGTPRVMPMVATIIHEGTHQLMFNRGMQTRFAESPLWLNEGLAIYFETPDADSKRGWRVPGLVSGWRLATFRKSLPSRSPDALTTMISSDGQFQVAETAVDAYAQAWAFNHFLLNQHGDEYVEYLKHMSNKKVLVEESASDRINDFKKFLGQDLQTLDTEFLEYVQRLK